MPPDDPSGRDALAQIDVAIAARPKRDGAALASATTSLAAFRDLVIVAHRQRPDARSRATLDRINAVLSVVLAAEFPSGEMPWDEMIKARAWLTDVVDERDQASRRE